MLNVLKLFCWGGRVVGNKLGGGGRGALVYRKWRWSRRHVIMLMWVLCFGTCRPIIKQPPLHQWCFKSPYPSCEPMGWITVSQHQSTLLISANVTIFWPLVAQPVELLPHIARHSGHSWLWLLSVRSLQPSPCEAWDSTGWSGSLIHSKGMQGLYINCHLNCP